MKRVRFVKNVSLNTKAVGLKGAEVRRTFDVDFVPAGDDTGGKLLLYRPQIFVPAAQKLQCFVIVGQYQGCLRRRGRFFQVVS